MGKKNKQGPRWGIVPFSLIQQEGRLDPGYYLGTDAEEEVERFGTYLRTHVPAMLRRAGRVALGYLASRYRLWRWRKRIRRF